MHSFVKSGGGVAYALPQVASWNGVLNIIDGWGALLINTIRTFT